jgi:hypothetical protein
MLSGLSAVDVLTRRAHCWHVELIHPSIRSAQELASVEVREKTVDVKRGQGEVYAEEHGSAPFR